ncbi:hypothetical protein AQB9606_04658 [Aquabacterium sp. CECT 9606]|nr:hypothetical protein AQB9606_04658 [Aquabacterium sp. CECT 9606]
MAMRLLLASEASTVEYTSEETVTPTGAVMVDSADQLVPFQSRY